MTAVARTRAELASARVQWAASGESVAVVMTMGALHAGHAELIKRARQHDDRVIVTDFLNPLQFAPGEDLDKYPRTFPADLELCLLGLAAMTRNLVRPRSSSGPSAPARPIRGLRPGARAPARSP